MSAEPDWLQRFEYMAALSPCKDASTSVHTIIEALAAYNALRVRNNKLLEAWDMIESSIESWIENPTRCIGPDKYFRNALDSARAVKHDTPYDGSD